METLKGNLVYLFEIPMSYQEATLEKLPVSMTQLLHKVQYQYLENDMWTFGFEGIEIRNFIKNEKLGYYVTNDQKNYIVIAPERMIVQKVLIKIMKDKIKISKNNKSNWNSTQREQEYYFYKKKLSNTKYFEKYPEDFL